MNAAIAAVTIVNIEGKPSRRQGRAFSAPVATGHHAIVRPGESVTLIGEIAPGQRLVKNALGRFVPNAEPIVYRRVFKIGDLAEYGSYNLSYYAPITKITAKTVEIVDYQGTCNEKRHRLSLHEFDSRNHDFDVATAAKRNSEWMD